MNAALATKYLGAGLSVIPLRHRDKRPLIPWGEFQQRRATETEIQAWWGADPDAGIAFVCGRVSSLVVLDEDPRNGGHTSLAAFSFPAGPTVRTGAGGHHFYFAHSGESIPKIPSLLPGVDVQGDGAYVVAPPSVHPNGTAYTWESRHELGTVALPAIPFWLRRLVRERQRSHSSDRRRGGGAGEPIEVAAILGRLHGVRRTAGGWTACCPAHEDGSPSLSIGLGDRGRVLLHCFAGCSYHEIRAALDPMATG
jgi:hypothetical protein